MRRFFKKYFIPHTDNDFRPHILQRAALIGILLFVVVSFTASNLQSLFVISSDWFISTILPAVIIDLTNEERTDGSLSGLTRSPLLDEAARLKAEDMAANEYFSHDSPEGVTPWYWFREVGYTYTYAGENLAVHFTDSGEVVDAWMDSPGHRRNILDEHYTEIGIGTAKGSYKGFPTVFVVQLFGQPVDQEKLRAVTEAEEIALGVATEEAEDIIEQKDATSTEDVTYEEKSAEQDVSTTSLDSVEVALVTEVVSKEGGNRVVYSGLATTSRFAALGVAEAAGTTPKTPQSNFFTRLLSQPRTLLGLFYSLLASFIFMALVVSIVVEWRKQHPMQIAYGTALVLLMAGVLHIHNLLQAGALVI